MTTMELVVVNQFSLPLVVDYSSSMRGDEMR